jgi:SAM-dependent methyltransferase
VVVAQFGPRAAAYVESATHRQGEDLQQLGMLAAQWGRARVLDLGCGGGHAAFAVAPHVKEVVAYDLSAAMLKAGAAESQRRGFGNLATRQGAVEKLPFADAEFDAVITRFSMHHWSDLGAALREARRVVKLAGHGVFIDTISPAQPALDSFLQAFELFRDPSHVRNYSEREFRDALAAAGFTVTAMTPRRIPINFPAWIERMNTPAVQAEAIRSVQRQVPAEARHYFAIADDGSFELDTAMFRAVPA